MIVGELPQSFRAGCYVPAVLWFSLTKRSFSVVQLSVGFSMGSTNELKAYILLFIVTP